MVVDGYIFIGIRFLFFFFLMIRRPPRSTQSRSSAASDVYKRQVIVIVTPSGQMDIISFTFQNMNFLLIITLRMI